MTSCHIPLVAVESKEFIEFVHILDPRFDLPSRKILSSIMFDMLEQMHVNIRSSMNGSGKVALTADVWTKRGLSSSYLGTFLFIYYLSAIYLSIYLFRCYCALVRYKTE